MYLVNHKYIKGTAYTSFNLTSVVYSPKWYTPMQNA